MQTNTFYINLILEDNALLKKDNIFPIIEEWFSFLGTRIERRSGKRNESTKFIRNNVFFNFLKSATGCSFYSGESKDDSTELETLNWSVYSNMNNNSLVFAVSDDFTNIDKDILIKHLFTQTSTLPIVYGYAFLADHIIGMGYSSGMVFLDLDDANDTSDDLAERVAKWEEALDNNTFSDKFRNIFPYNIFSADLFKFTIEDLNIVNWIKTKNMGVLEDFHNLKLWKLDESDIDEVRRMFIKTNKICET